MAKMVFFYNLVLLKVFFLLKLRPCWNYFLLFLGFLSKSKKKCYLESGLSKSL